MKFSVIGLIINLVLMAVTDALMYLFIKDWTNTMICSIIMIDLSYVLNICAFIFVPEHKNSYIFQASTSILTSVLIILEIILMIVGIFVEDLIGEPYIMVGEVVLFIIFMLLFVTNNLANKHTAQTADVDDEGIARIKDVTTRLNMAFNKAQNPDVKKLIERAYDDSRAISSYKKELESFDAELQGLADNIANIADGDDVTQVKDLCNRFTAVVVERQNKARQLQN